MLPAAISRSSGSTTRSSRSSAGRRSSTSSPSRAAVPRPGPATIAAVGRRYRIPLPALAGASLALVTGALVLVFFVVPNDLNQGVSQRIFYFHVSIAFTAYACFAAGAWMLVAYFVSQAALLSLAYTLYRLELSGKRLDMQLRELRRAYA